MPGFAQTWEKCANFILTAPARRVDLSDPRSLAYKRFYAPGNKMKPAPFVRHVPRTLDEALKILAQVAGQDGRVLAGGQSLVPIMAFRLAKPAHLVDINEVDGLDKIVSNGKMLSIGARVRHGAFHKTQKD